jgi:hypothetical protein
VGKTGLSNYLARGIKVEDDTQILALGNSDEKSAKGYARIGFVFRTTAQNPRPNPKNEA